MNDDQSRLGLDEATTIWSKLFFTLIFFTIAGFLLIFTAFAFFPKGDIAWKLPAEIAVEVCWSFWLLGLAYVWFRPNWLRRIYLAAEKQMIRVIYASFIVAIGALIALIVFGLK